MKKIERLKSSIDSNIEKETVGQRFSQLRDKLNEMIDYINDKEEMEEYERCAEKMINKFRAKIK